MNSGSILGAIYFLTYEAHMFQLSAFFSHHKRKKKESWISQNHMTLRDGALQTIVTIVIKRQGWALPCWCDCWALWFFVSQSPTHSSTLSGDRNSSGKNYNTFQRQNAAEWHIWLNCSDFSRAWMSVSWFLEGAGIQHKQGNQPLFSARRS